MSKFACCLRRPGGTEPRGRYVRSSPWWAMRPAPRGSHAPAAREHRPNYAAATGFTLLELMIVLAITTVVLAVAWPTLRRPLQRSGTLAAARQLADHVALARQTAIERGETLVLRFEPDGYRYRIETAPWLSRDEQDTSAEALAGSDDITGADRGAGGGGSRSGTAALGGSTGASDFAFSAAAGGADSEGDQPLPPFAPLEFELPHDVKFTDPATADQDDPQGFGERWGEELAREGLGDESVSQDGESQETTLEKLAKADEHDQGGDWSTPILFYPTGRTESMEWRLAGNDGYWVSVTLRGMLGAVRIGPLEHPVREGLGPAGGGDDTEAVQWSDTPLNAAPVEPQGPPR